mmetsp:Transcript_4217/g.15766  ORF Transcript_4217/g.15766 Transcript_4217/m.15766 type:complete len:126 (-) Transcript_4217:243-620(-)
MCGYDGSAPPRTSLSSRCTDGEPYLFKSARTVFRSLSGYDSGSAHRSRVLEILQPLRGRVATVVALITHASFISLRRPHLVCPLRRQSSTLFVGPLDSAGHLECVVVLVAGAFEGLQKDDSLIVF